MAALSLKEVIQKKLEEKDISVRELERQAGVARTTIVRIMEGLHTNPTLETLQALARVLECDIVDLLTQPEKNAEPDMLQRCKTLPWNNALFLEVSKETCRFLDKNSQELNLEKVLLAVIEVYSYCLSKKEGKFDSSFHEWFMQKFISNT